MDDYLINKINPQSIKDINKHYTPSSFDEKDTYINRKGHICLGVPNKIYGHIIVLKDGKLVKYDITSEMVYEFRYKDITYFRFCYGVVEKYELVELYINDNEINCLSIYSTILKNIRLSNNISYMRLTCSKEVKGLELLDYIEVF